MDFAGDLVVKNPPADAGDTSLIPGPRKSHLPQGNQAHVPQLLSLRSRAHKPHALQLLKPVCPAARTAPQERPLQWKACTLQLERAWAATKTQQRHEGRGRRCCRRPSQETGRRPTQTVLQRRHTDGSEHTKQCPTPVIIAACRSEPQWGITSHQSEWPLSESLQTVNAGEGVEKRKSCATGGNINWYNHYRE